MEEKAVGMEGFGSGIMERGRSPNGVIPEPSKGQAAESSEVQPGRTIRRRFTSAYKLRVLERADRCSVRGELGSFLRRERLYSSQLNKWRKERAEGALERLNPKKRGRKPVERNAGAEELRQLQKENERLKSELLKKEKIVEVQKKLFEIFGTDPNEVVEKEEN